MIRTVEQYLESLRDGRVIYCLGERVKDVTTHPVLRRNVKAGAMDWVMTNDPERRSLFVSKNEEGEEVHFTWTMPKTAEDLLQRRKVHIEACRFGGGGLHAMGADAVAAARILADKQDKALGTNYTERVENYIKYIQKTDIGLNLAMTDVKGDRGIHPSKQVQHKDFFVRVIDRRKEGIIVRGAKYHISMTPSANDMVVMPCRNHFEEDKDYAVYFSTPLNAKGLTLICSDPEIRTLYTEETAWDYPDCSMVGPYAGEAMVVFDDVFVPWERVFMCGEWQFTRDAAYLFSAYHRLFAATRMIIALEDLTGVAALMAEYNGLEKYSHIREKLAWLVQLTETVKCVSEAACRSPEKEPDSGIVFPNKMLTNIAKNIYADNFHQAMKHAQDICGGIAVDPPVYRDWANPELRPYLEKYLAGKAGIATEYRLRAIRFLKDLTGWQHSAHNVHGEGSLAAQTMMIYTAADFEKYKMGAKRTAGIPGWEKDPFLGSLPDGEGLVEAKMPPVDTSYAL